jgi:hypothetical protein
MATNTLKGILSRCLLNLILWALVAAASAPLLYFLSMAWGDVFNLAHRNAGE